MLAALRQSYRVRWPARPRSRRLLRAYARARGREDDATLSARHQRPGDALACRGRQRRACRPHALSLQGWTAATTDPARDRDTRQRVHTAPLPSASRLRARRPPGAEPRRWRPLHYEGPCWLAPFRNATDRDRETFGEPRRASRFMPASRLCLCCPIPTGADLETIGHVISETVLEWRRWADRSSYVGRWREQVTRSALALKLLTSYRYGSIAAAATSSAAQGKRRGAQLGLSGELAARRLVHCLRLHAPGICRGG